MITDCCDEDPNKGQIGKSIANKKWFIKWGHHYLKSIASAYRQEWCLNFKDLSPQHFTSSTFETLRANIENIFIMIAAPIPSIVDRSYPMQHSHQGMASAATPAPTPIPASIPQAYYNMSGG